MVLIFHGVGKTDLFIAFDMPGHVSGWRIHENRTFSSPTLCKAVKNSGVVLRGICNQNTMSKLDNN